MTNYEQTYESSPRSEARAPRPPDFKFIVSALTPIFLFFLGVIISSIGYMVRDKLEGMTQSMYRMETNQQSQNERIIHLEDFIPEIRKRLERMEAQGNERQH